MGMELRIQFIPKIIFPGSIRCCKILISEKVSFYEDNYKVIVCICNFVVQIFVLCIL